MLTLFAGESVNTAIKRFVEANNINEEFVPVSKEPQNQDNMYDGMPEFPPPLHLVVAMMQAYAIYTQKPSPNKPKEPSG